MDNIFSVRKKALSLEKENIQRKLEEKSFDWNMNRWLARCFDVNITNMNQSKDVIVEKVESGVFLKSSLREDEERYFHFDELELVEELTSFLKYINDQLIALTFEGNTTDCALELRLTFKGINDKEKEVRLSIGEKTIFRLHHLKELKSIKLRIRLKGSGSAFIRNPQFLVKNNSRLDTFTMEEGSNKSLEDINILHINKDNLVQRFKSYVHLISVTNPDKVERDMLNRSDVLICSSSWLATPLSSHNHGYINDSILNDLLYTCVIHDIPTVIWDISPPEHVSTIAKYAKHFDYVLTTNKQSVENYKYAGCKHVFILPFRVPLKFPNELESYYLKRILFTDKEIFFPEVDLIEAQDHTQSNKERLFSLRNILENHTIKVKLEKILDYSNVPYQKETPSTTMIARIGSKHDYEWAMKTFRRQVMEGKKLVLLIEYFDGYLDIFNQNNSGQIKTYLLDYIHHYDSINEIIETSHYAPISTNHYYGKNYLKDMFLTTLYIDDAIIVKHIGKEYTFVTKGNFDQALIPISFSEPLDLAKFVSLFREYNLEQWFPLGARFFNTDNFNLISNYEQLHDESLGHIEI